MSSKKLVAVSVVVLSIFVAAPKSASAATIAFDVCSLGQEALCGQVFMTTTLVGNEINVSIFGEDGFGIFSVAGKNNGAFALNIAGDTAGLKFSNFSSGFGYTDDTDGNMNGWGKFEYLFDGPQQASGAFLPLDFTISRDAGFASDTDLFEGNPLYWAAIHVATPDGLSGFVASNTEPCVAVECDFNQLNTPVPEPATMLLLGTGLLIAVRARRKKTS